MNILCDGEFTKVVANHLGLDLNLVELLSGVNTDDAADHLGDNDHVTQVGLDEVGLLVGLGLLLGLAELLDQAHGLALKTTVEPAAGAGVHDIAELFGGEVEEPVVHSMSDNGSFMFLQSVPVSQLQTPTRTTHAKMVQLMTSLVRSRVVGR